MEPTGSEETVEPSESLQSGEPTEAPETIDTKYEIVSSTNFEVVQDDLGADNIFNDNGIAWFKVEDPETHRQYNAIVNTSGEIVYLLDPQDFGFDSKNADSIFTNKFFNGNSAVYVGSDFFIVNESGEEIYKNTDKDHGSFLNPVYWVGFRSPVRGSDSLSF